MLDLKTASLRRLFVAVMAHRCEPSERAFLLGELLRRVCIHAHRRCRSVGPVGARDIRDLECVVADALDQCEADYGLIVDVEAA